MKFVNLGIKRAHRRGKFDKPSPVEIESLPRSKAVVHQVHTYTELRQQIHDDLPIQHPEWVEPNGESLMFLMQLLDSLTQRGIQRGLSLLLIAHVNRGLEGKQ